MEFVLIMILYTGSVFDSRSNVATATIYGFKNKEMCENAVMQTKTRNNVNSFCVKIK